MPPSAANCAGDETLSPSAATSEGPPAPTSIWKLDFKILPMQRFPSIPQQFFDFPSRPVFCSFFCLAIVQFHVHPQTTLCYFYFFLYLSTFFPLEFSRVFDLPFILHHNNMYVTLRPVSFPAQASHPRGHINLAPPINELISEISPKTSAN